MNKDIKTQELEVFIRKHYASAYAFAINLVESHEAAEDILQEVFTRYWQKKEGRDEPDSADNFLFIMVRNASLNYLRGRKREAERHKRIEPLPPDEPRVFRVLLEEELNRMLYDAVARLPLQSARIIRLALSGLDNREIAATMGISVNTVKTLKYGAIRKLRERFDKMDI